jgi:hypothetical protein
MKAYIRKLNGDRFYIILGSPENHETNTVLDEPFNTRRTAERYLIKHGYEQVKRGASIIEENIECECPLCSSTFQPPEGESAIDFLAKSILVTFAEMQVKGIQEDCAVCPRCGIARMIPGATRNALSRQVDRCFICSICGMDEAVRVYADSVLPLSDWWLYREVLRYRQALTCSV